MPALPALCWFLLLPGGARADGPNWKHLPTSGYRIDLPSGWTLTGGAGEDVASREAAPSLEVRFRVVQEKSGSDCLARQVSHEGAATVTTRDFLPDSWYPLVVEEVRDGWTRVTACRDGAAWVALATVVHQGLEPADEDALLTLLGSLSAPAPAAVGSIMGGVEGGRPAGSRNQIPPTDAGSSAEAPVTLAGNFVMGLDWARPEDPDLLAGVNGTYAFTLRGHAAPFDAEPVAAGIELSVGGGGGFLYNAALTLGPGAWVTDHLALALTGGVGFDGITGGGMPVALGTPLEAWATLDLTRVIRLEVLGGVRWLHFTDPRRDGGSTTLPFVDEVFAEAGLFLGKRWPTDAENPQSAVYVGGSYREAMGTRLLGLTLGFGLADLPENAS